MTQNIKEDRDTAILGAVAAFVQETEQANTGELLHAVAQFVQETVDPVLQEARAAAALSSTALRSVEEARAERLRRTVTAFEDEILAVETWLAAITPPPAASEGATP